MGLHRSRNKSSSGDFPTVQLFLLAIVRLAEPIALTSVFPYAWALVKRFKLGDEQDASFYAGLLISTFSLAEALMGMYWGGLSDRIGRKPVLIMGSLGTALSMLVVGFSSNIWVAIAGRAIGGLLNGNVGVVQTMVGELVKNPDHEPRAYAVMPFVWHIGTIIGPTIGGTCADPHLSFPDLFPEGSLFEKFPYLLPNVICALLLLTSVVLGYLLLEETHPEMVRDHLLLEDAADGESTPISPRKSKGPAQQERYGTFDSMPAMESDVVEKQPARKVSASLMALDRRVIVLIVSLSIFTYHSMSFDHLLPIFFEDERVPATMSAMASQSFGLFNSPGGLGLSVRAVGIIMAVNGVIALFVQAVIFPIAAEKIGVYRLFILVTVLHPIIYLLVPLLLHVPESLVYPGIYFCLAVRNVLSIIIFPLLLILIKEATPSPNLLGKVNGLAASAGAACRMAAPPVAGYLYTSGSKVGCTALAWFGSALVASVGSFQCFMVERPRAASETEEEGGRPAMSGQLEH